MNNPTLYARLLDAKAHLGAARIQRAPSDDAIIAEHIEAAERIVGEALREIETTPPVITHPRPSYHRQAEGLRAEDVLPDDAA